MERHSPTNHDLVDRNHAGKVVDLYWLYVLPSTTVDETPLFTVCVAAVLVADLSLEIATLPVQDAVSVVYTVICTVRGAEFVSFSSPAYHSFPA